MTRRWKGCVEQRVTWSAKGWTKLIIARQATTGQLMQLAAAIAVADLGLSLRGIATQLDQTGERPARGWKRDTWNVFSGERALSVHRPF
ncbi:hypothetical protein [Rhizobium sp. BR 314]|uniref:hypothetical protein n=1 Tax=Rhizobium sp. BR 314 TaxID=3040013 RepID=UPI0039BF6E81